MTRTASIVLALVAANPGCSRAFIHDNWPTQPAAPRRAIVGAVGDLVSAGLLARTGPTGYIPTDAGVTAAAASTSAPEGVSL